MFKKMKVKAIKLRCITSSAHLLYTYLPVYVRPFAGYTITLRSCRPYIRTLSVKTAADTRMRTYIHSNLDHHSPINVSHDQNSIVIHCNRHWIPIKTNGGTRNSHLYAKRLLSGV